MKLSEVSNNQESGGSFKLSSVGSTQDPVIVKEIPQSENLIQRAIKHTTRNFPPFGGQPETVSKYAPELGQLGGSVGGFVSGASLGIPKRASFLGGTVGRATGELASQAIDVGLNPSTEKFNIKDIGKQAAIGAGTEVLGAGFGKLAEILPSGAAAKFFGKATGLRLGDILSKLEKSGVGVNATKYFKKTQDILATFNKQIPIDKAQSRLVNNTIKDVHKFITDRGDDFLSATDLTRISRRLGQLLKKIKAVPGNAGKTTGQVIDKDVAQVVGDLRRFTQDTLAKEADNLSSVAGKELRSATKAFSETAKRLPKGGKGAGAILPDLLRAGAFMQGVGGQFPEAIKALVASEIIEGKAAGKIFFHLLQGTGKVAPTALGKLISEGTKE